MTITEISLYEPMRIWLSEYLYNKYQGYKIVTIDSHNERLDRVLMRSSVSCNLAIDIDIQIDILGIAKSYTETKLFFIEAKKDNLTLRDLGQLWAYCKLIDPEEAFLFTSATLGSLEKLINVYKREDLLVFGNNKKMIKRMKIGMWDTVLNCPIQDSIRPRM